MKIVSWNINSVRARLQNCLDFIQDTQPDIIGLQELKCTNEQFPLEAFEEQGYNCYVFGQKAYNGVALLSKLPMSDITCGLPDFDDTHSRYIAGHIDYNQLGIEIINCYMPNGNPVGAEKYTYKLSWLQQLVKNIRHKIDNNEAFILMGDFNIIPTDFDVHDPTAWQQDALFMPEVKALYHELLYMGLTDAIRFYMPNEPAFTFWDYQGRARELDKGIRIDHFLVTSQVSDIMSSACVLETYRDTPKASDHAPILLEIE